MKSALVENGVVKNVIKGTAPGYVQAPDNVDIGDFYDGSDFHKVSRFQFVQNNRLEYKPLADLKALRERDITEAFYRYRDAGTTVTVGGQDVRVETTHAAQTELQGLVARLERVGGTQRIVTRSGARLDVDAATAAALRDAVEQHLSDCYSNDAALRDDLEGLDEAGLEAFDPDAGWPSVPE